MRRLVMMLALAWCATAASVLDRWQSARTGNRLYDEGKFDDAAQAYNQGLTDDPDSAMLHFNLGAAEYKRGQYDAALKALQQVPTSDDDPARGAAVAYNAGNTAYKLGAGIEDKEPQKALEAWAQALAFYRRALGLRPDDVDTKFNYEFVHKRIDDLRQKLEDQKKQQDQKDQQKQQNKDKDQAKQDQQKDQQPSQPDQPKQDQEKQDEQGKQQDEQQKGDDSEQQKAEQQPPNDQGQQEQKQQAQQQQPPSDRPPSDQQQATGGNPDDQQPQQGEGADSDSDVAGEKKDGEMSKREAAALLDGQRNEEVQPDEIVKRMQPARVGRPAKDW